MDENTSNTTSPEATPAAPPTTTPTQVEPSASPAPLPPAVPIQPQPTITPAPTPSPAAAQADVSFAGLDPNIYTYIAKRWWIFAIIAAIVVVARGNFIAYGIIAASVVIGILKNRYEKTLFAAFAKINNYTFSKQSHSPSTLDGLIFQIGHGRNLSDIVTGTYQQWPFQLYMYRYTIGYGKQSHTYDRAVVNVAFGVNLPAFVLRRHSLLQHLENEGESLNSMGYTQKVSLEGDFNQHFDVYIRPDSQVEVLSVLTPDVMQILLGLDRYEIELTSSGNLYIYCHGYITRVAELTDMYKILEAALGPVGRYAERQQTLQQTGSQI